MPTDLASARTRAATVLARIPRAARVAVAVVAALALLHGALQAAFALPAVEQRLRARIAEALAERVGGELTVGPDVDVDALYRVTFGPVQVEGPADGVARVRIGRVKVRPRWTALLAGRLEPASVRLLGVHVELAPGRAARRAAGAPPTTTARAPAPAAARDDAAFPVVHLRDLDVVVEAAGRTIALGPVDGRVERTRAQGGDRVSAALWRGGAKAELTLRRDARGALDLDGRLAGVPANHFPAELVHGALAARSGALSGTLHAEAPADLSRADATVRVDAERLVVEGPALGPEAIGPMTISVSGTLRLDRAAREVRLEAGALDLLGAVHVQASGSARLAPGVPLTLAVRADGVDYRRLAGALPPALALPADAPRPGGTFDVSVELDGPILRPSEWGIAGGLDLARLREAARKDPPVALRRTFAYRPDVETGRAPAIRVGPESPTFVPIAELPEHVVRAVTTSEDAGFFGHQGFDLEELKNAFAAGAEQGRVVRGGSTITQQLAKNLYLSREKTLARKVREAILTIGLEASVPKSRLLEIYLNIAEWGPGLYGIGPAARHWFGVDARALTPKQAAFLASVIPNPVRYHFMYARGALTDFWDQKVSELLLKMSAAGVLTDDDLVAALAEPLVFARPTTTTDGPG